MNYRIEKKEAFRIVGVKKHMEWNVEENFAQAPQLWAEVFENGKFETICNLSNQEPYGVLGISTSMNKNFDYYIACSTNKPKPENMYEYEVPATTWAIFECVGPMPNAIQEIQKRITTEWLPTSGYEYGDSPDIEVYPEGDAKSPDYKAEVWLPIVKKQ